MVGNEGSHGAAKGVPLGLLAPPAFVTRDGRRRAGVRVEVRVVRVALSAAWAWASRDGTRRAGVRVEVRVVRLVCPRRGRGPLETADALLGRG